MHLDRLTAVPEIAGVFVRPATAVGSRATAGLPGTTCCRSVQNRPGQGSIEAPRDAGSFVIVARPLHAGSCATAIEAFAERAFQASAGGGRLGPITAITRTTEAELRAEVGRHPVELAGGLGGALARRGIEKEKARAPRR